MTRSKCIAVNYRLPDDLLASDKQGCWKEFTDEGAARIWLNWRKGKTNESPKGVKLYPTVEHMQLDLLDSATPETLKKAIRSYFKWLQYDAQ
jgi:hypothetical protein